MLSTHFVLIPLTQPYSYKIETDFNVGPDSYTTTNLQGRFNIINFFLKLDQCR